MNRETIRIILIFSFLLYHAFEWYLDYLDTKHMNAEIPENVRDVYNEEEYRKWVSYHKENMRFSLAESLVSFLAGLLMLVFNFYALVFSAFSGRSL
ncbi:MAG: hypothetical protein IJI24_09330, partial [Lachnospiraceae bacterium]|nr:hypothetical protein [Lachnospiraceae bacterium]